MIRVLEMRKFMEITKLSVESLVVSSPPSSNKKLAIALEIWNK